MNAKSATYQYVMLFSMNKNRFVVAAIILIVILFLVIVQKYSVNEQVKLNTMKAGKLLEHNFNEFFHFLHDDPSYMAYAVDCGEWGAAILFIDKYSGKLYSYNMPLPINIDLTEDGYIINAEKWNEFELYYKKEVLIYDPSNLAELPDEILDLDSIGSHSTNSKSYLASLTFKILNHNLEYTLKKFHKEDKLFYNSTEDSISNYGNKSRISAAKVKNISDKINHLFKGKRRYRLLEWYTAKKDSIASVLNISSKFLFFRYLDSLKLYEEISDKNWDLYTKYLSIKDSILSNNENVEVLFSYNKVHE